MYDPLIVDIMFFDREGWVNPPSESANHDKEGDGDGGDDDDDGGDDDDGDDKSMYSLPWLP